MSKVKIKDPYFSKPVTVDLDEGEPLLIREDCKVIGVDEDPVNHPEHYTYGSVECIDAMLETQGVDAVIHFCECNAFKYMWRHRHKKGVEDLKKASWYLIKALELIDENMGSVSDGR